MTNKNTLREIKFRKCSNCGELNWIKHGLCDKCHKRCKEAEEYVYRTIEYEK